MAAEPIDRGPADCARAYPATAKATTAWRGFSSCLSCPKGFKRQTDLLTQTSYCDRAPFTRYRAAKDHGKHGLIPKCGKGRFAEEFRCWSCPKGWKRAPLKNDGFGKASCRQYVAYTRRDPVERGPICAGGYENAGRCLVCPEGTVVGRSITGFPSGCVKPGAATIDDAKKKIEEGLKRLRDLDG